MFANMKILSVFLHIRKKVSKTMFLKNEKL